MKRSDIQRFIRQPKVILILTIIVIAIMAGGSCFYIVDETEQAVITRFGRYYATVGAGLQFKLPFGIDKSYTVPVKLVQTEQFGFKTVSSGRNNSYQNGLVSESTMLTGDLNIVDVEWIIQYKITAPRDWLFGVKEKKQTIRDISRSVVNMLVGDRAILDIMGQERTTIEESALDMMNENFSSLGLGISVIAVKLQNIVPPEGVQAAFEDVNKATQDMNRFINEGMEAYNSEIPKATGEAEKLIQQAQGYATSRVNQAKGDVARFNAVYEEYRKAPQVTRQRIYLETMQEIFSNKDSKPVIIDGKLQNMLPLKNITGIKE